MTHGVPSGKTMEEKRAERLNYIGGTLTDAIQNKYLNEGIEQAQKQDAEY